MADPRRDSDAGSGNPERDGLAPTPSFLLDDPLAFIDAEHARHRSMCRILRRLAIEQRIERSLAHDVVSTMTNDLALHRRDEDEDLFPLLLKRALPEDGLAPILAQLGADHIATATQARKLAEAISPSAEAPQRDIGRRAADLATRFVAREQRHLAIEAAIVMVIARKRLKPADLQAMSRSMKMRRGVAD